MGIRGLTTFINNRSHLYLKDYQLHDCNVILDGNSIASTLYKWHCRSNDCFSGDYDKFGNVIYNFFKLLSQCNITPYVIFDGGYEKRKLATVISRMKNKIRTAHILNPTTEGSESVFPLFLREVFLDILKELGIKSARCEFEGDMEIARIAKALECPVISYDSDFYIFGCLYIPFSTVELVVKIERSSSNKISYLPCKIYKIENFLKSYGGLNHDHLPLLAVILGNDYVKGSLFRPFFRNLKIQKCTANQSDQQKRIKSVIVWLQNENVESAIKTILSRFKNFRRKYILKKIQDAMKGYFDLNSEMLQFLGIDISTDKPKFQIHFDGLEKEVETEELCNEEDSSNGEREVDSVSDHSDVDIVKDLEVNVKECEHHQITPSEIFLTNFLNCQYPSCFMDMLNQHRYYCIPQVEDSCSEHSHIFSLEILSYIYKILCQSSSRCLTIVCRSGKERIQYMKIPNIQGDMYSLEEIQSLSVQERKIIMIQVMDFNNKFLDNVNKLPSEWHLFLISLYYTNKRASFDKALIISIIICFYILNYVDDFVGFCRTGKTFEKKFLVYKSRCVIETKDMNNSNSLGDVSLKDCMFFMSKIVSYFQMDIKLKINYRLYDKLLVHSLSQFQSILLHVKYLNLIFNCPFPSLNIHKIFDGTFVYNMTKNLRKRSNIVDYLEQFLCDSPGIMDKLKYVINSVDVLVGDSDIQTTQRTKKRKKKKKQQPIDTENVPKTDNEDSDIGYKDPNNPYSLLTTV